MNCKIHIAGLPVRVGNRKRQLCAWCGHPLIDVCLEGYVSTNGWEPAYFDPNDLISVEGENPRLLSVVQHVDGDPIPVDWCGGDG